MPPILGGKSLVTSRCFTPHLAVPAASTGLALALARRAPRPPPVRPRRRGRGADPPDRAAGRPRRRGPGASGLDQRGSLSSAVATSGSVGVGRRCRGRSTRSDAATAGHDRPGTSAHGEPAAWRRPPRGARATTPRPRLDPDRRQAPAAPSEPVPWRRPLAGWAGRPPDSRRSRRCERRAPPDGHAGRCRAPGPARPGNDRRRSRPARRSRRSGSRRCSDDTPRTDRRPAPRWPAAARSSRHCPARTTSRLPDAAGWRSSRTSPSPARCATSRSTRPLSSASTRAR